MINNEQLRMLHRFVILDLAIQSLQRDFQLIENLKMSKVYLPIYNDLLNAIRNDYYNTKRLLTKDKIKVLLWEKIDEYYSDLTVNSAGNDIVFRYTNQVLEKQVEVVLCSNMKKVTHLMLNNQE